MFNGEAYSFAAQSAVLDSSIGHGVDAKGWNIVDDHSADFYFIERVEGGVDIGGEDAGLEPEAAVVDSIADLGEIGEWFEDGYRSEGFFTGELAVVGHVLDERCLVDRACSCSPACQGGASGKSVFDP